MNGPIHNQSGGVNFDADQVNIDGDVVGRDKIEQHTTNTTIDQRGQTVGTQYNVAGNFNVSSALRGVTFEEYLAAVREYCANLPYLTLQDIRPPKMLDEVYVPLKARPQPRRDERERLEPLSIAEVMQQHDIPHVLILGEPGAGKSTLLRQMAERSWDKPNTLGLRERHLPLLVPLRQLSSASGSLDERLSMVLKNEMALPRALPDGFFDDWPRQTGAHWLILLDALDEVPDSERARLMQWLKGQLPYLQEHRVVITSRPSGYKDDLSASIFSHYDLQPFTSEQTGDFARKWFSDKAEAFLKELDRIRTGDLRGTPLLLTIAAKVFGERGILPERRSGLYNEFIKIWLEEASQNDRLNIELGERLTAPTNQYLERLEHLALRMTEKIDATSLDQLRDFISEHLQKKENFTPGHARNFGKLFVEVMARCSGVFTRRDETYEFVHTTFREYLTARAIVRECRKNFKCIWQRAISRWQDEHWREAALLALGILSDEGTDVTPLLNRIPWYRKEEALYFVCAALSEQIQASPDFASRIINTLLDRTREMSTDTALGKYPNPLSALAELRAYPYAATGLVMLVRNGHIDADLRLLIIEVLNGLGRVNEVLPTLVTLDDETLAWWAISYISEFGGEDLEECLTNMCDTSGDTFSRVYSALVLGWFNEVKFLTNLEHISQTDSDEWVRRAALEAANRIRARLGLESSDPS